MFAALCVLLAATGHLLMSGRAVPWPVMPFAFAATAVTAWALAGRERGPRAVTPAAVAVQAFLHALFSLAQSLVHPSLPAGTSPARQWAAYLACGTGATAATGGGPGAPAAPPVPESAAHLHHAVHDVAPALAGGAALSGGGHDMAAVPPGGMSPAGMLTAHLLAAVVCGLWLAYGERAVFRVLRALSVRFRTPLRLLLLGRPAPALRPRLRVRRTRRRSSPRPLFLVYAITSRGPPTGVAVL
ncbi:hypothetical protein ACFWUW_15420 [Streptomyces sp. NPDC058655]|uniref:hypothetical protein n=1 Tax=Streptomyces sp. NPDC058655 TaxID=3346577 RepID=UPI003649B0AF